MEHIVLSDEDRKHQDEKMKALVKGQDFYDMAFCLSTNINHEQFIERVKILKDKNFFIS